MPPGSTFKGNLPGSAQGPETDPPKECPPFFPKKEISVIENAYVLWQAFSLHHTCPYIRFSCVFHRNLGHFQSFSQPFVWLILLLTIVPRSVFFHPYKQMHCDLDICNADTPAASECSGLLDEGCDGISHRTNNTNEAQLSTLPPQTQNSRKTPSVNSLGIPTRGE